MHDVLIIGGGVIGLSLAWDLARHGRSVHVIDRAQPGREASWAGAGILPTANLATAVDSYDQLCGLASQLHPQWADELHALTGIDTGYRRCGGIYIARTPGEAAALAAWAADLQGQGIAADRLTPPQLADLEPGVAPPTSPRCAVYYVPGEAQLRNPRHLKALVAACTSLGVQISPDTVATGGVCRAGQLVELLTATGPLQARQFCFTPGAWTGQLLADLGVPIGVFPVRGQMVLFHSAAGNALRGVPLPITHIINEGSRYLVPRDDGRLLAGSTEEEVGFDKRTTDEGLAELIAFARSLVPALADATIEQTWAGLRPGSLDGLPFLGPLPGLSNAFLAAGHFRSGLFLSTATAVVMSQLLRGQQPQVDLAPFRVGR